MLEAIHVMLTHVGYLTLLYQLQKFMKGKLTDSADDTLSRITETRPIQPESEMRLKKHGFPKSITSAPYLGYEHKVGKVNLRIAY